MKKLILMVLVSQICVLSSAFALESISCSEKLDETMSAAGKTNVGLGTEHNGSAKAQDWEFSINDKVLKIERFRHIVDPSTKGRLGYQVTSLVDHKKKTGYEFNFYLQGCETGAGRMERRAVGGKSNGLVVQALKCGCSID